MGLAAVRIKLAGICLTRRQSAVRQVVLDLKFVYKQIDRLPAECDVERVARYRKPCYRKSAANREPARLNFRGRAACVA